ncbi:MAG: NAD(P)/FAD-dependent oxidoreductase [Pseudomonadota bacterium]
MESREQNLPDYDVLIIGSGFSGLGMAIALHKNAKQTFKVIEKGNGVGGTWRDNTYPGCACDVPSRLYSFSFAPNPNWSRVFAPQAEIRAYLEDCARKFGVLPHIQFNTEVREARYDERGLVWHVTMTSGEVLTARVVVSGQGALHIPKVPSFPGLERFEGDQFHSAQWPETTDLKGRKVAVIGTGASAIQIVPHIVDDVAGMVVFQRNAAWIQPKPNWKIGRLTKWWLNWVPFAGMLNRSLLYWLLEMRLPPLIKNSGNSFSERMSRKHLERQVEAPALREKLTPTERFGCKRVLLSNDFYPAVARSHVTVETNPIQAVGKNTLETKTGRHEVDTIIWCTGFAVTDVTVNPLRIVGRKGRVMKEEMSATAKAYLGISVEGYPNFFMLMGPHTGLGHNSMIYMIESQIAHVMAALEAMGKHRAKSIEVRPEAQERFEDEIDQKMEGTVWKSGCDSWYADKSGRISTIWPDHTYTYRARTRQIVESDYRFENTVAKTQDADVA